MAAAQIKNRTSQVVKVGTTRLFTERYKLECDENMLDHLLLFLPGQKENSASCHRVQEVYDSPDSRCETVDEQKHSPGV